MKLADAIHLIQKKIREDGIELEDGDEVVSVFNNGTIVVGLENHELELKILMGEPYTFNENIEIEL